MALLRFQAGFELKVPCVQSRRLVVSVLSLMREDIFCHGDFRGPSPQCRRRRLLVLVLNDVFRCEKFWLTDHMWITV